MQEKAIITVGVPTDLYTTRAVELFNTVDHVFDLRPMTKTWSLGAIYGKDGSRVEAVNLKYRTLKLRNIDKFLKSLTPKSRKRVARSMLLQAVEHQTEVRRYILKSLEDNESLSAVSMSGNMLLPDLEQSAAIKLWFYWNYKYLSRHFKLVSISEKES